jgi:hypothetical protein
MSHRADAKQQRKDERRAAMDQGPEALRAVLARQAKEAGRSATTAEIDATVRHMLTTRRREQRKAREAAAREREVKGEIPVRWFSRGDRIDLMLLLFRNWLTGEGKQ